MSTPQYCEDFRPHEGHEWHWSSSYYFCWGVKETPELASLLLELDAAEAHANSHRLAAATLSVEARRSEGEFYGTDGLRRSPCADGQHCVVTEEVCSIDACLSDHSPKCCDCGHPL